mmetsp:Transcript_35065/g.68260  ORF Transcript_35065/g.68260 Transcript_35065/m.68260 type:complete len:98 (+) Transcript_35065:524-817(+)
MDRCSLMTIITEPLAVCPRHLHAWSIRASGTCKGHCIGAAEAGGRDLPLAMLVMSTEHKAVAHASAASRAREQQLQRVSTAHAAALASVSRCVKFNL